MVKERIKPTTEQMEEMEGKCNPRQFGFGGGGAGSGGAEGCRDQYP